MLELCVWDNYVNLLVLPFPAPALTNIKTIISGPKIEAGKRPYFFISPIPF